MEDALFAGIIDVNGDEGFVPSSMNYEEGLFEGMVKALEVLKEIHRSRGENVDEEIQAFTKRNLQATTGL